LPDLTGRGAALALPEAITAASAALALPEAITAGGAALALAKAITAGDAAMSVCAKPLARPPTEEGVLFFAGLDSCFGGALLFARFPPFSVSGIRLPLLPMSSLAAGAGGFAAVEYGSCSAAEERLPSALPMLFAAGGAVGFVAVEYGGCAAAAERLPSALPMLFAAAGVVGFAAVEHGDCAAAAERLRFVLLVAGPAAGGVLFAALVYAGCSAAAEDVVSALPMPSPAAEAERGAPSVIKNGWEEATIAGTSTVSGSGTSICSATAVAFEARVFGSCTTAPASAFASPSSTAVAFEARVFGSCTTAPASAFASPSSTVFSAAPMQKHCNQFQAPQQRPCHVQQVMPRTAAWVLTFCRCNALRCRQPPLRAATLRGHLSLWVCGVPSRPFDFRKNLKKRFFKKTYFFQFTNPQNEGCTVVTLSLSLYTVAVPDEPPK